MNPNSPFDTATGSDRLSKPGYIALALVAIVVSAFLISKMGIIGLAVIIVLPILSGWMYVLFKYPITGLYTAVVYSFVYLGLGKYISGIQFGILLDALLILTYIALILNKFRERVDWSPIKRDITYFSAVWFAYLLFQIFNPEAQSLGAWSSGRGLGLYMFLAVPLTLLFINTNRKLDTFLLIWAILSILASLKGIMQVRFGADPFEQAWLNEGNYKTHVLFGKLRAFSFMSDAGQFGANQGYSAVMAIIVATSQKDIRRKIFFLVVGITALYGLFISGTRGALSVPLVGFTTYFILKKNLWITTAGFVLLVMVFIFFKFTTIGQGNANIRRMRTAFDPNDASLQVRLANQRVLKSYMASRPFGGGLGHGGVKAQRYLPNAFLSQVPTDSGYVLVWVELGIVGLLFLLFIFFYVLIKASYRIMFRIRDPVLKIKMAALASGMAGIMVANYGNAVYSQNPTFLLMIISMAILVSSEVFDNKDEEQAGKETPVEVKGNVKAMAVKNINY